MTQASYTYNRLLKDRYIFVSTGKKHIQKAVQFAPTVNEILKDYTKRHPNKEILFTGSTPERTRLYTRILTTYYLEFKKDFHISSITISNNTMKRTAFDPARKEEYLAFLIKRF